MIDCELHDHVEIMCMHHDAILVHLVDGSKVKGIAQNTRSSSQEEFLQVLVDKGLVDVPLAEISMVEVKPFTSQQKKIWFR